MGLDFAAHPHFLKELYAGLRLVTSPESQFPPGLTVAEMRPAGSSLLQPQSLVPLTELRFVVILIRRSPGANGNGSEPHHPAFLVHPVPEMDTPGR